jgi:predicted TIM-barrel fold metal-dependent hydrolase
MIWGGDWPVVNLGGGLSHWVKLTRSLFSQLSSDEGRLVQFQNAREIYRLAG